MASSATRFGGWSSTIRMRAGGASSRSCGGGGLLGVIAMRSPASISSAASPKLDQLHQLVGVDRLGQVVRCPGRDALLPVLLERLGGDGDDGQRLVRRI